MGTEPKLTEDGAREIGPAADALCWPDGLLDAPLNPTQPELHRVAKNKRTREIDNLPAEVGVGRAAFFSASRNISLAIIVFILLILVCRPRGGLLSLGAFMGQGCCLHLNQRGGGKRRAASQIKKAARRDGFNQTPSRSMGRWLKLQPSWRSRHCRR